MAKKIVVIEDDKFLSKVFALKLRAAGYELIQHGTGGGAVEKVVEEMPDLVILDLVLPRKNGFDILEELKANSATKDIPVVVASNLSQKPDIQKVMDSGAEDFFVKSNITFKDLQKEIESYLQ